MNEVKKKYGWLIKHLIWNGPKPTGNTFWVKITPEDAEKLKEGYEVCETRTLKGGHQVEVVKMCENFVVLDTSDHGNYLY